MEQRLGSAPSKHARSCDLAGSSFSQIVRGAEQVASDGLASSAALLAGSRSYRSDRGRANNVLADHTNEAALSYLWRRSTARRQCEHAIKPMSREGLRRHVFLPMAPLERWLLYAVAIMSVWRIMS